MGVGEEEGVYQTSSVKIYCLVCKFAFYIP